jgi:hypothetical protein
MIHVGQNLPPQVKVDLANEMFRILKPGGNFGLYDPVLPRGPLTFRSLENPFMFHSFSTPILSIFLQLIRFNYPFIF